MGYGVLIALAGLPGTGKSALARELARSLPATVLDKDLIRAGLFPPDLIEYSRRQDDFVMSVVFQTTGYLLRAVPSRPVILDGRTYSRRYQVDALRELAADLGAHLRLIECVCLDETARVRLERDSLAGSHPAANRTYELYLSAKARAEPIVEPKLVVDTDRPLAECVQRCLSYIRAELPNAAAGRLQTARADTGSG